jgi:hypothetical protein
MNSLSNQRQLIVKQFGFTPVHTTLIGCVDGVVESELRVVVLHTDTNQFLSH